MSITTDAMLLLFQRYGPPLQDVVRAFETGRCDINSLKDSLIGTHATFILDGCDMPPPCLFSFHLFLVRILSEEMLAINMGDVRSLNLRGVPDDAWDTIFERALDICLDHTSGVVVPYGSRTPHRKSIYASVMAVVRLSIDMYHADTARRTPRARPAPCSARSEVRDTARADDVLLDDGRARLTSVVNLETGLEKVWERVLNSRPFSSWIQTWCRRVDHATGELVEPSTRPGAGEQPYQAG